jgi:hypothetical protein
MRARGRTSSGGSSDPAAAAGAVPAGQGLLGPGSGQLQGQLSSTGTLSVRELLLLLNSALQASGQAGDLVDLPVGDFLQTQSSLSGAGSSSQQQQQQQH